MNAMLPDLIPAIVSAVNEQGGYVTKTKLLKLLYLLDVEFYRAFGRTYTGFEWKFFHLGPWTAEYDQVLEPLFTKGVLEQEAAARSEYDTQFIRSAEHREFSKLFPSFSEEIPLRRVLSNWAGATTGEILDFVYFRTEPMEHGVRNAPLDFAFISREQPARYVRAASGTTPKEAKRLRETLKARLADALRKPSFEFTPPRYDDVFEQEMSRLEDKQS